MRLVEPIRLTHLIARDGRDLRVDRSGRAQLLSRFTGLYALGRIHKWTMLVRIIR